MIRAMLEEGGSVRLRASLRKSVTVVMRLMPGICLWPWEQKRARCEEQRAGSMTGFGDPLDLE